MSEHLEESIKMKVFPKGQVVIPVALRKKYKIDIHDQINVISTPEGILLKPIPKEQGEISLTSKLFGVFSNYSCKQKIPEKAELNAATEKGFVEGWNK